MENGSAIAPSQPSDARMWAVVHFGDKYVEVTDEFVTLQDLCSAFEVHCATGVHIADCATKHAILTLPFECLSKPQAKQRVRINYEEMPAESPEDDSDEDSVDGNDDGDDERRRKKVAHFDLILDAHKCTDAADVPADAVGVEEDNVHSMHEQSSDNSAAHALTVVMRYLAKLGALQTLSAELPQRLKTMPRYSIGDSPHLLNCCVYADHIYSPHRRHRDPLMSHHLVKRRVGNAGGVYDCSQTYRSAVEEYDVGEAVFGSESDAYHVLKTNADTYPQRGNQ